MKCKKCHVISCFIRRLVSGIPNSSVTTPVKNIKDNIQTTKLGCQNWFHDNHDVKHELWVVSNKCFLLSSLGFILSSLSLCTIIHKLRLITHYSMDRFSTCLFNFIVAEPKFTPKNEINAKRSGADCFTSYPDALLSGWSLSRRKLKLNLILCWWSDSMIPPFLDFWFHVRSNINLYSPMKTLKSSRNVDKHLNLFLW